MKTPTAAFRPLARSLHLELSRDGVVSTRDIDTADEFVPGRALGAVLERLDVPFDLAQEVAALRKRWLAQDRLEDLHHEATRGFRRSRGVR